MSSYFVPTSKKVAKHTEGEVWQEDGKTWTIKNGIKRTVTKMDQARKEFLTPLACPKCNGTMNHYLHEKMWSIHKMCFECVIKMEHEIMKAGKWKEYERAKVAANATGFLKDLEQFFQEFTKQELSNSHVTEDGMVEKWNDNTGAFVKEIGDTSVKTLTNQIEEYISHG